MRAANSISRQTRDRPAAEHLQIIKAGIAEFPEDERLLIEDLVMIAYRAGEQETAPRNPIILTGSFAVALAGALILMGAVPLIGLENALTFLSVLWFLVFGFVSLLLTGFNSEQRFVLRLLLALPSGVLTTFIAGSIGLEWELRGVKIDAAGGFAVAVLVLLGDPRRYLLRDGESPE